MNGVCLIEIGPVDRGVMGAIADHLAATLGMATAVIPGLSVPSRAWDLTRRQYAAIEMLRQIGSIPDPGGRKLLGVTECDLYIPVLSFVFGQAQLQGRLAVISLARLRQEFYGLPPHRPTLISRALTEAVHELGHTFGLVHCADAECVMSLAIDVRQVDRKKYVCRGCLGTMRAQAAAPASATAEENES